MEAVQHLVGVPLLPVLMLLALIRPRVESLFRLCPGLVPAAAPLWAVVTVLSPPLGLALSLRVLFVSVPSPVLVAFSPVLLVLTGHGAAARHGWLTMAWLMPMTQCCRGCADRQPVPPPPPPPLPEVGGASH